MKARIRHDLHAEDRSEKIAWFLSLSLPERLAHAEGLMRLLRAAGAERPSREEDHANGTARVVRLSRGE
jgi:hypothetical protein